MPAYLSWLTALAKYCVGLISPAETRQKYTVAKCCINTVVWLLLLKQAEISLQDTAVCQVHTPFLFCVSHPFLRAITCYCSSLHQQQGKHSSLLNQSIPRVLSLVGGLLTCRLGCYFATCFASHEPEGNMLQVREQPSGVPSKHLQFKFNDLI